MSQCMVWVSLDKSVKVRFEINYKWHWIKGLRNNILRHFIWKNITKRLDYLE